MSTAVGAAGFCQRQCLQVDGVSMKATVQCVRDRYPAWFSPAKTPCSCSWQRDIVGVAHDVMGCLDVLGALDIIIDDPDDAPSSSSSALAAG